MVWNWSIHLICLLLDSYFLLGISVVHSNKRSTIRVLLDTIHFLTILILILKIYLFLFFKRSHVWQLALMIIINFFTILHNAYFLDFECNLAVGKIFSEDYQRETAGWVWFLFCSCYVASVWIFSNWITKYGFRAEFRCLL